MTRKRLGEILLEGGLLDEARLQAALLHQQRHGGRLGRILVETRVVTEERLVRALSRQLQVPVFDLDHGPALHPRVVSSLPRALCEQHHIIAVALKKDAQGELVAVAMADPTRLETIDAVRAASGRRVEVFLAGDGEIERALAKAFANAPELVEQPVGAPVNLAVDDNEIPLVTGAPVGTAPVAAQALFGAPGAFVGSADDDDRGGFVHGEAPARAEEIGLTLSPVDPVVDAAAPPAAASAWDPIPLDAAAIGLELSPVDPPALDLPALEQPAWPANGPVDAAAIGLELSPVDAADIGLELSPVDAALPADQPLQLSRDEPFQVLEAPPRLTLFAGVDEKPARAPDGPEAWSTSSQLTVDERRLFPVSAPHADINFDAVQDSGLDEDFLAAALLMPPPRPSPGGSDADDDAPMPPPSMLPSDDDALGAAFDAAVPAPAAAADLFVAPPPTSELEEIDADLISELVEDPSDVTAAGAADEVSIDVVDGRSTPADPEVPLPNSPPPVQDAASAAPLAAVAVDLPPVPTPEAPGEAGQPMTKSALPQQLLDAPFCPDCGANRVAGARFCPYCGTSFSGASRAKGQPAGRQAPPPPSLTEPAPPQGPLDVEAIARIEGRAPGDARGSVTDSAHVDTVAALVHSDGARGVLVATAVPIAFSEAQNADGVDVLGGLEAPRFAAAAPAVLRMARDDEHSTFATVDRVDVLVAGAPPPRLALAPTTAAAASLGSGEALVLHLERDAPLRRTSEASVVDDERALSGASADLGLVRTVTPTLYADAALVDDARVLAGAAAPAAAVPRQILDEATSTFARADDALALAAEAPAAAGNLVGSWSDVAERPLPRPDRVLPSVVPVARETLFAVPAPVERRVVEPVLEYRPAGERVEAPMAPPQGAPAAPAAAPAVPWAVVPTPPALDPAAAASKKGITPTMILDLDPSELRALAERLVQKGAVADDDLDAAKKKDR